MRYRRSAVGRPPPIRRQLGYFGVLLAVSAMAYVPLAIAFTPWAWSNSGLFAVQLCRPLLYAVYFFAGVGIGGAGIERGLIAVDGILARRWVYALAAALASLFLWMGLTALTMPHGASLGVEIAADLSFVPACAAGCFFLIAVCLRFATGYSRLLGYLSANAYGLYLVHYVFIVWLQYALLAAPLFAIVKAAIVFGGTLVAESGDDVRGAALFLGRSPHRHAAARGCDLLTAASRTGSPSGRDRRKVL